MNVSKFLYSQKLFAAFFFQKAKVALMSCFLEKVKGAIRNRPLPTPTTPPVFPVNLSHFRCCSVARDWRPPLIAAKKRELKSCVVATLQASKRHPASPELPDHTLLKSPHQGLFVFMSTKHRAGSIY